MVDLVNIAVILNLEAPQSVKQLHATLGHIGYYSKFIKSYAQITMPMEKLLKRDVTFCWNDDCMKSLNVLNGKLASAPILVFLKWDVEFHVHVDALCITLGAMLTQEGREGLDHPIVFASRRLSKVEKNYSTTECEGLAMVYVLQKYRHYFLGGHFKMYTDHSALKYLVNKPVLGGHICRWILLFQEYDFEVILKLRHLNAGLDHLSRIETGEEPTNLEEGLPDAQLYAVRITDSHFKDIIDFLTIETVPQGYSV